MRGVPDGDHHKAWMIDQIVRIITECPPVQKTFRKGEPNEYTATVLGESDEYRKFLADYADGEDGPHTYAWDIGIAP